MPTPDLIVPTGGGGGSGSPPCYLQGTRIATPEGAVSVEDLAVGSLVLTASEDARPVRWLGHRGLDCTKYREPAAVWPVCVRAHAFAPGKPERDLWLSPGHAVFVGGVLVQAANLINGATIVQVPRARVDYWHVELDSHDILVAEGLPAESYLDTGNRTGFTNGGAFLEAFPDFQPKQANDTCVPLVCEGPALHAVKSRLLDRAHALGHSLTDDSDAHVVADGLRVDPTLLSPTRLCFVLPAARSVIEVRCREFVPAQVLAGSDDRRALGLCVGRLQIDGNEVPLEDEAQFPHGWHALEHPDDGTVQRWTRDRWPLPAGTRLIVIDLAARSYCWSTPGDTAAVQTG